MNETVLIAILGALGGGIGVQLLSRLIAPAEKRMDDATAFRKEMREEIIELRGQVKNHQVQIDEWQARYFALQVEYTTLGTRFEVMVNELASIRGSRAGRRATDLFIPPSEPVAESAE